MSAFITLGNAARYLAGEDGSQEEVAMFAALLASEADALHAVKDWTEHYADMMPGGISYYRPAAQWRIPKGRFVAWCDANGYPVEQSGNAENPPAQSEEGRRAQQIGRIREFVQAQCWDALRIPTGGKQKAKAACLEDTGLFTKSGFTRAWQAALDDGIIRTENHEKYARR